MLRGFVFATSSGGGGGGGTVTSVGGASPSSGAITVTAGGSTGISVTPSGNDLAFRIAVTSQAAGDLIAATSGTAWGRVALGPADALLGVNGGGTAVAYTLTPWLTALRVGLGGSTAANVFGTATVQSSADAVGGEGFGVKAHATAGGYVAFYDSSEAVAGHIGYDQANDRFEVASQGKVWRVSSDAPGTVFALAGDAGNANVHTCGATAPLSGMVGGITIGPGTTVPSSVSGTVAGLFNSAGALRLFAGSSISLAPGSNTDRARCTATVLSTNSGTNISIGSITGSFGGATNALFVLNGTAAGSNPTGGFVLYGGASGEPLVRTPGGAIRGMVTIGAASAAGLFVAASSGGAVTRELKKRTITVSDGTTFEMLTAEP